MAKRLDLTGQRFGRLVAIRYENGKWLCQCDCGNIKAVSRSCLRDGGTRSCGCLRKEHWYKVITTQGGGFGEKLYGVWCGMRERCYCKTYKDYKYYGARGIALCDEWKNDYQAFKSWAIANGYAPGLTIDRINGDLGYAPENCRWITIQEQQKNRRPPRKRKPKNEPVDEVAVS